MDHLQKLHRQVRQYVFGLLLVENIILLAALWTADTFTRLPPVLVLGTALIVGAGVCFGITQAIDNYVTQPIQALWQAILHLSPTDHGIAAPQIDRLKVGQELVASLATQIYQLADTAEHASTEKVERSSDLSANFVAQTLPLPFFALDSAETITFANEAAGQYLGIAAADLIGKNVYMVLDMSFPSEETFDDWLKEVKAKSATSTKTWERVRLNVRDGHPLRIFDLASYYNRDNPLRVETILVLFDHTKMYSQDDQAVSFIALSVHELRTPLTLLRGYIEVFEDEIDTSSNPEFKGFMLKMKSQAEQLNAFVNNVLNVARIDDDQLQLKLQEEEWPKVLKSAVENLGLRAKVRDVTLHCHLATDLPTVGIDRISIYEVINNLVDNAIKYSGASKEIEIETHLTKDGLVETTVQDFGLGIATATVPNLFTKFFRDHRNRAQIGGTGLGLYLSKAIVSAHGGSIWVRSKEGEGSTFGFTLIPYAQLSQEIKENGDQEITRSAHGWIKNHSMYRR